MMNRLAEIPAAVGELIWPRTCHSCGVPLSAHQHFICDVCMASLPRVPYGGKEEGSLHINDTEGRLAACRALVKAGSWIYYGRHEPSSQLLQDMKYRGCRRLARHLGRLMAAELETTGIFQGADCIVPVPLHFMRRLKRGYNQSRVLAEGVSEITGLPVIDALLARRHTSQTHMTYARRLTNVRGIYSINPRSPLARDGAKYKHILLLDDVCTTGSTLLNCADALTAARPDIRISALTLALAL